MDRSHLIEQTNLAFDFLQKLYLEVSYLIKEVEGILLEEEERFVIGRTSGYSISARSSTGLESNNVAMWLLRKFSVFFVPEEKGKLEKGQTMTSIVPDLKVLYLRIVLNDKNIHEPAIYSGILYDIHRKPQAKWLKKFENLMAHIEYNNEKMFKNQEQINHEDAYVKFRGKLVKNNLYSINDSESINNKVVKPMLELYRKAQ